MRKSKNGHDHFRDNLGALKPRSIRTICGLLTGPGALMSLLKPFKAVFVCRQLIDYPPCRNDVVQTRACTQGSCHHDETKPGSGSPNSWVS